VPDEDVDVLASWPPEPTARVFERGRLRMERAHGCIRDLTWRIEGHESASADWEHLVQALVRRGCEDRTTHSAIRELRTPQDDVIVLIPRTARLELRVWGGKPYAERVGAARALLALVHDALSNAQVPE